MDFKEQLRELLDDISYGGHTEKVYTVDRLLHDNAEEIVALLDAVDEFLVKAKPLGGYRGTIAGTVCSDLIQARLSFDNTSLSLNDMCETMTSPDDKGNPINGHTVTEVLTVDEMEQKLAEWSKVELGGGEGE